MKKFMSNWKVAKKLIVSFILVTLITAAVGAMGIIEMRSMSAQSGDMYTYNLTPITALANLREIFGTQRSDFRALFLSQDNPAEVQKTINKVKASDETVKENFALYETAIQNEDEETGYFKAKTAWEGPFAAMKASLYAAIDEGDFERGYQIFIDGGADCIVPITEGLAEATLYNDRLASDANDAIDEEAGTITVVLIAVIVAAAVISMILAFYVSNLISKPLKPLNEFMKKAGSTGDIVLTPADVEVISAYAQIKDEIGETISACASFVNRITEISHILETIANGDISQDVKLLSNTDTMGVSLKKMVDNLNHMFSEIHKSSSQVTMGSSQIADGAQSLASGSTEQAATLEELTASIASVSEQTKENADRTETASKLAESIMQNAEKGNRQMEQMIAAVNEINQANQNISKVIAAIDGIAFQTNILALNAAVEAARAGAAGKGFAVVADEVRTLSAKSANSAQETESLIADSMEKARHGAQIAGETAASLNEIVSGIRESAKIIAEIAQSSEAQSESISQINLAIGGVTQVVQQNSATAEESAAASEEMSGQASVLEDLIAQFKLRKH